MTESMGEGTVSGLQAISRRPMTVDSGLSSPRSPNAGEVAHIDNIDERPPMWIEYGADQYYVRECYMGYYELIMEDFTRGMTYVTLTGTPGTGKSVFYLYFFDRFRAENPDITIVTAAFTPDRALIDCVVYEPGKSSTRRSDIPSMGFDCLHIYDGAPDRPPRKQRMICFSSPNSDWRRPMSNMENHVQLVFPRWDLKELIDAAIGLDLGFEPEIIEERYSIFGGIARFCLCRDKNFAQNHYDEIRNQIGNISSFEMLRVVLAECSTVPDHIGHSIVHMTPMFMRSFLREKKTEGTLPYTAKLCLASPHVARLLDEQISRMRRAGRKQFLGYLISIKQAEGFLGWLFEGYVKDQMQTLTELVLQRISKSGKTLRLALTGSDSYEHMSSDNCESLDGVVRSERGLFLFQITRSDTHPVSAKGIWKYLDDTQQLLFLTRRKLFLVFVVPKGMDGYKAQEISLDVVGRGDDSDVAVIHGIGHKAVEKLSSHKILKVGQLRSALNGSPDKEVEQYRGRLARFDKLLKADDCLRQIAQIPQYLFVSDGEFK